MESPETNKPNTATTSSDSLAVQDSPIFSYISKLSPIKPVKAAPVAQGFPGLNSPPLVFTSPRINPHRKSCFLKRPQCPRSFTAELFRQEYRGNYIATATNESVKSTTQLSNGLNPCLEKGRGINGSVHDQAGSPSGCVDEYLADLLEVDWEDSAHSANLCLKQSDNDPQSLNGLMESVSEADNKDAKRKDVAMMVGASPAILEQAQESHQEKSPSNVKPVETDGKQGAGDMAIRLCPKLESDVSVDHASDEHSVSEFLPESRQIVKECDENCGETTGAVSSESVENMMRHDCKIGQRQCGMRRRCLQFEEAQQKSIANSPGPLNSSNSASSPKSAASPSDLVVLETDCVALPSTPSSSQLANMTQPTFSMFSSQNNGNSSLTVSKPPGIGLHLNSIVNAMPVGCGATTSMKSAEKGCLSVQGKKLVSITSCHISEDINKRSMSSNVVEKVSLRTEDGGHDSSVVIVSSSVMSPSPNSVKSSNNPVLLNPTENQATPCDKGKSDSRHADGVEFNQSSPRKKRKKTSGTSDGDGCKRCNCKKTKCLKLYCDCFAAGIYCAEPCSCQGCFNRPDYEDTVLETRQQIESRNPLAFAPKIVQRVTGPFADSSAEDGNRLTPSSARHKRGCNCKKSMCLKKYCECYQANVGCSDGCRCEGCKNVYGRKGEYGLNEDIVSKEAINERLESSFDEKLEMVSTRNSLLHAELCNPHNLTPLTPSFQCSDRGKEKSTSWFPSRRYLPSPESNLTFLAPYGTSLGSPRNSDNRDMILEKNKEILDVVSFDQELDYCNAESVDEFSSRCQGFGNIGSCTVMPNLPSMDMASLTSPTTRDWTNGSRTQFFPGSGHFSSVNSLRWRSSPITPMMLFAGTKRHPVLDSYDGRCSITGDDTPEILKDTPTPLNAVKVSSPNKKRVSPPYSRLHELGSSSSAGLKNGRKFILQAVPSFPPLTPCIDSKGSTSPNTNDPQDCDSSK